MARLQEALAANGGDVRVAVAKLFEGTDEAVLIQVGDKKDEHEKGGEDGEGRYEDKGDEAKKNDDEDEADDKDEDEGEDEGILSFLFSRSLCPQHDIAERRAATGVWWPPTYELPDLRRRSHATRTPRNSAPPPRPSGSSAGRQTPSRGLPAKRTP